MASHGVDSEGIEEFTGRGEDWPAYLELLEQYLLAKAMEAEGDLRKVAVFLTVISSQTYNLLRSL